MRLIPSAERIACALAVGCLGALALCARPAGLRLTLAQELIPLETLVPTRPTVPQTIPPTRDTTPTATVTPTHTPTPRPVNIPLIVKEVRKLRDGGFESGAFAPHWAQSGALGRAIVDEVVHTGYYAARLGNPAYNNWGGCPVGRASISQVTNVPDNGHPELHVWYRVFSHDTVQFDYFAIELARWPNGEPETVWLDGSTYWLDGNLWRSTWREAVIGLDDYRGQNITVTLYNAMTNSDGYYNTWTYVDDIGIKEHP